MKPLRALLLSFLTLCASGAWATAPYMALNTDPSPTGTVDLDVSIPKTGGGFWPQKMICLNPGGAVKATIVLHGGGGDNVSNIRQYSLSSAVTVSYAITGASYNSANGGSITYTVSTDPTSNMIVGRNPVTVAGNAVAGYNGNTWPVIASDATHVTVAVGTPSAPYTDPGAWASGGSPTISAYTIDAAHTFWRPLYTFGEVACFPQGQPALGGTDYGNTPSFTAAISNGSGGSGTILNVSAIASGVLTSLGVQTVSGTGVTGGTTISSYGTSTGFSIGTLNVNNSQNVGSEAMTANGCPYAPNSETWSNWSMTSCQDDASMLVDAKSYIHMTYNIANKEISITGHSNGGFMVQKIAQDNPTLFSHYGMFAGPKSIYYLTHPATPASYAKMMFVQGDEDCTIDVGSNCVGQTNTPNVIVAGLSGQKLHVSSITSGTITAGEAIWPTNGVVNGQRIVAQITTEGGDLSTWSTSKTNSVGGGTTMYVSNFYAATTSQNTANATAADLVVPLPMTWTGISTVAATWATGLCAPASLNARTTINPADAVVTAGAEGTVSRWDYCLQSGTTTGQIVVVELSNAPHQISGIQAAWGVNPLIQYWIWKHNTPPP